MTVDWDNIIMNIVTALVHFPNKNVDVMVNFESEYTVVLESDGGVAMCIVMEGMLEGINISVIVEPIRIDIGNNKIFYVPIYLLENIGNQTGPYSSRTISLYRSHTDPLPY